MVVWPTFGGSLPVVILVVYGVLLCASDDKLSPGRRARPDRRADHASCRPGSWCPSRSSRSAAWSAARCSTSTPPGLTLLTLGLRTPRWVAAAIDGVLMILGTIYIVWVADSFLGVFMAFLIILGVPMAAWCGIFLADLLLRRRDYDERQAVRRAPRRLRLGQRGRRSS